MQSREVRENRVNKRRQPKARKRSEQKHAIAWSEGPKKEVGGGRAQGGGKREGPRDAGGGGCRGSSRSGSSLQHAHSLSVPGAGYPAQGGSQLALLPENLKPLRLRGTGPWDWLARALGTPRKQVDGWVGSAGTRSLGALWVHWAGVLVPVQGRKLCSFKTNFPPARWISRLLWPGPGSGRRVWREAGDGWACWSALGSVRDEESSGVSQARVLRPQSVRSGRRLHVQGKTLESRRGCPGAGTCQLCMYLGTPDREPPQMCGTCAQHRVFPTREPTQSFGAAHRSPRSPSPACALRNLDSLFFFLFPTPHSL